VAVESVPRLGVVARIFHASEDRSNIERRFPLRLVIRHLAPERTLCFACAHHAFSCPWSPAARRSIDLNLPPAPVRETQRGL
jgi:hypothetical protein